MNNRVNKIVVSLAFAIALPLSASAGIKSDGASVRIDINGIDISSKKGMDLVEAQVRKAARKVCGPVNSRNAGSLANARQNRVCYERAVADALFGLDQRRMTAQNEVR